MRFRVPNTYLETEVLTADPVRLVQLTYRGAIEAVAASRQHLASGAIGERSKQINKALRIVHELLETLDRERGGEIARNLAGLYAYISTRLIEANSKQIDAPLAEVEKLLATLAEAWTQVIEAAA
jgi:flagellar protein FliS